MLLWIGCARPVVDERGSAAVANDTPVTPPRRHSPGNGLPANHGAGSPNVPGNPGNTTVPPAHELPAVGSKDGGSDTHTDPSPNVPAIPPTGPTAGTPEPPVAVAVEDASSPADPGSPTPSRDELLAGCGTSAPTAVHSGTCELAVVATNAGSSPVAQMDRWMEQSTAFINSRRLGELVIPGTHESGSYGLIDRMLRLDDPNAPEAAGEAGEFNSLIGDTRSWSQTTERTISRQLNDGIRALDLHVCSDKRSVIRLCNHLYGPTLEFVVDDVARFVEGRPKELVILSVRGFTDWTNGADDAGITVGNMSPNRVDEVKATIQKKLAPYLFDHSAISPMTTMAQIWSSQPKKNVVVVFDYGNAEPFWGQEAITIAAASTWEKRRLQASLQKALSADVQICPHCTLFQLGGHVKADSMLMLSGLFATGNLQLDSLRDVADLTNPVILGWIRDEWNARGLRSNVIIFDYYERTCLVPFALSLNGIPGAIPTTCSIGIDKGWSQL